MVGFRLFFWAGVIESREGGEVVLALSVLKWDCLELDVGVFIRYKVLKILGKIVGVLFE